MALRALRAQLLPQVQTAARIQKLLERRAKLTTAELAMHTRCVLCFACIHLLHAYLCAAIVLQDVMHAAGVAYPVYV